MNNAIKDTLSDSDISTVKTDSNSRSIKSKITSVAIAVALTLGTGCKDNCDNDIRIRGDIAGDLLDSADFGARGDNDSSLADSKFTCS